jgi:hypothetical protein
MLNNRNRIIICICAIVISCIIALLVREYFVDGNGYLLYYRTRDNLDTRNPSLELMKVMQDASVRYRLKKTDVYKEAQFILFETLNMIDTSMVKMKFPPSTKYIYGINGTDMMVSKSMMALILKKSLSRDQVDKLIPRTYILNQDDDIRQLHQDFAANNVYIMKKNIQRQEGVSMVDNLDDIMRKKDDYVVAQLMLQDPYIIRGMKINMRVYFLVVVDVRNDVHMYIYDDGFMYYTPKSFEPYTKDPQRTITTGYIDRSVYDKNPLTFRDLEQHLTPTLYMILFRNILKMFTIIKNVYNPIFKELNKNIPGVKFLVYGCDVAPAEDLSVKLMEVNKGPDLSYKDERDGHVKANMMDEALSIVGMGSRVNSNFIKL